MHWGCLQSFTVTYSVGMITVYTQLLNVPVFIKALLFNQFFFPKKSRFRFFHIREFHDFSQISINV